MKELPTAFKDTDHKAPSPIKGKAWIQLSTEELLALARKGNASSIEEMKFRYNNRLTAGKAPNKALMAALTEIKVLGGGEKKTPVPGGRKAPGVGEPPAPIYTPLPTAGGPPAPAPGEELWDKDQISVIQLGPSEQATVDAGPGCGKTAVACARIAYLIEKHDVEPHDIWLLSFTRTAVKELRIRIGSYLEDSELAFGLRLATLDSHAWAIHSGFNVEAKLSGLHEHTIEAALALVRKDHETAQSLASIRHLVIDEAQDITGIRADLVEAIIGKLDPACGVSIFSDEAQSIYGFTEEASAGGKETNLAERIRTKPAYRGFRKLRLETIHRTGSKTLSTIFREGRGIVNRTDDDHAGRLLDIKDLTRRHADAEAAQYVSKQGLDCREDILVLFRSRAEVLHASDSLSEAGIRHRLRMSGLGHPVFPWIALLLWDQVENRLSKNTFLELWAARIAKSDASQGAAEAAWRLLMRFTGRGPSVVDLDRLRNILARSQPPADFCMPEFGTSGSIIGTIHASKGRESEVVHLMIPPDPGTNAKTDFAEEARIVFVGATRARNALLHAKGFGRLFSRVLPDSRRIFAPRSNRGDHSALVQFGIAEDFDAAGLASRALFGKQSDVEAAQKRIQGLSLESGRLEACRDKAWDFRFAVTLGSDERPLLYSTKSLNDDLFPIGDWFAAKHGGKFWAGKRLNAGYCFGLRTLAVPEGPHGALHEPWSRSRFLLAPMIVGFSYVRFFTGK